MRLKLLIFIAALIVISGCGAPAGTPVPAVIYVTATSATELQATGAPTYSSGQFPTAADTPLFGPTEAETQQPTFPPLPTATRTPVPTLPPTLTPSFTPEFTDTPVASLAPQKCSGSMQPNGFTTLYRSDRALQAALGCPQSAPIPVSGAVLNMENGIMVWVSALADQPRKVIYALYGGGTYQRFDDSWIDGVDPVDTGVAAPAGRKAPIRGFGKVWKNNPGARSALGWALTDEAATSIQIQRFERGELLYIGNTNTTYVFAGGKWRADGTRF